MTRHILLIALGCSTFISHAQDAEGCKDLALFTRMPHFVIEECQENYDAITFQTSAEGREQVEGNINTIRYAFDQESGEHKPSPLQIVRNYENAVKARGGRTVYTGNDDEGGGPVCGLFRFALNNKDLWLYVGRMYEGTVNGQVDAYSLVLLAREAMHQDVQAAEMFDAISKSGSVALYVNFATGKAEIEASSQGTIEQLARMLASNPSLNVNIEGHTDNTGTAEGNKTLSLKRAESVVQALVAKGIAATRMGAKGMGQEKPLADNDTEEGRAKNRRVEVVRR